MKKKEFYEGKMTDEFETNEPYDVSITIIGQEHIEILVPSTDKAKDGTFIKKLLEGKFIVDTWIFRQKDKPAKKERDEMWLDPTLKKGMYREYTKSGKVITYKEILVTWNKKLPKSLIG